MKKTIIFDFDGTIADTMFLGIEIYNQIAETGKFKMVKQEDVDRLRGKRVKQIMKELNIGVLDLPVLMAKLRSGLKDKITEADIFNNIEKSFINLKNGGYDLGILSSNSVENLEIFLEKNNIRRMFDFVYSEKSVFGKDKALKKILKEENLSLDSTWYVGDEIRDIKACNKVGLQVVSVSWGFNSKDSLLEHNKNLVENPVALSKYFIK